MARTQKNKATSGHLGLLKARLAKLRRELIEPKGGGGGGGEGFDVAKTGDARIGFVGKIRDVTLNLVFLCHCLIFDTLLWNHFNSWRSMFMDNQNSAGS
jgi:hypothetical protein